MTTRATPFWRALLWVALAVALTMALLPKPPDLPIELSDKVQHMAAFGVLTALCVLAYPRMPLMRVAERMALLGAMIELVQSIPALHRSCDILDWVADMSTVLAVLLVVAIRRRVAT